MMKGRDEILAYLADLLGVAEFPDYGPQGLQVEGRPQVRRVVSAVTASAELIERAAEWSADLILAHHGIFWDRDSRVVKGPLKRRLEGLLRGEMTLAAYHLCLDAHATYGNNALAAQALGLTDLQPWARVNGKFIGWRGNWADVPPDEALERVASLYGSTPLAFMCGPGSIRKVGIISGGAQSEARTAAEEGIELFITGEASEYVMHVAREYGIHFIAAGHHATERLGIRSLGEHTAQVFGLEHQFIDIPNPV